MIRCNLIGLCIGLCLLAACDREETRRCLFAGCDGLSDSSADSPQQCNLLTQAGCGAGEKCTWLLDALMPVYVGHIGCAPDGTAFTGAQCAYGKPGAAGYDGCREGNVCSRYRGETGVCRQVCDVDGGTPVCDAQHVCVGHADLFTTTDSAHPLAGVCELACDPLADNDFDGSGSASTRTKLTCGFETADGCYGYPSFGTPPATGWSCAKDIHAAISQPIGLRHRVQCTHSNDCATPKFLVYVNSCNQGYLPLLRERTLVSTAICVAICKPKNCFAGNCGLGDEDRRGEAPHRCTTPDRVGTFDRSTDGEHCRFQWSFEIDEQNNLLRSSTSDTVGFCFDHSKYLYDTNNDNTPDRVYPPCASLPDGFGSGSTLGAADLGCVDTTHAQLANGKTPRAPRDDLRPLLDRRVAQ